MPSAAVTADFGQPLDIHGDFTPQVALNGVAIFNGIPDFRDFFIIEVFDPGVWIDRAGFQNLVGQCSADAENIAERDFNALVVWQIHT
jgi:hypothetical protein